MARNQVHRLQKIIHREQLRRMKFNPKLQIDYGVYNPYKKLKSGAFVLDESKKLEFVVPDLRNCDLKPYVSTEIMQNVGMLECLMKDLDDSIDRKMNLRKLALHKTLVDVCEEK